MCMIGGAEAPNGFQWKINFGQKSLVSIKSTCIIKVWAAGNRCKLHLSLCPGALCLIKGMGFPWSGGKVEGSDQWSKREVWEEKRQSRNPVLCTLDENVLHHQIFLLRMQKLKYYHDQE